MTPITMSKSVLVGNACTNAMLKLNALRGITPPSKRRPCRLSLSGYGGWIVDIGSLYQEGSGTLVHKRGKYKRWGDCAGRRHSLGTHGSTARSSTIHTTTLHAPHGTHGRTDCPVRYDPYLPRHLTTSTSTSTSEMLLFNFLHFSGTCGLVGCRLS